MLTCLIGKIVLHDYGDALWAGGALAAATVFLVLLYRGRENPLAA